MNIFEKFKLLMWAMKLLDKGAAMLDGYRTYIAGIASILSGLGMIATGITQDPLNWELINQGWVMIVAGLAVFGIGAKIQKLITKGDGK